MSVYLTAIAKAVEFATEVEDNIERQHTDDVRGEDVSDPDPVAPDLSVLVHQKGITMLPADAATEVEQYLSGIPARSLDGAVIHSDTLCSLRGWR